jgi:hypothetical protein
MTLDKIKVFGVTLPTNGKIEDLIKLNCEEKKQTFKILYTFGVKEV